MPRSSSVSADDGRPRPRRGSLGRGLRSTAVLILIGLSLSPALSQETPAEEPAANQLPVVDLSPPLNAEARDNPNDNGHGVLVTWELSPDDEKLLMYDVLRGPSPDAPDTAWIVAGSAPAGFTEYVYKDEDVTLEKKTNPRYLETGETVYLRVRGRTAEDRVTPPTEVLSAVPEGDWYHTGKTNILIVTLLFGFGVIYFIRASRKGRELYIRPIPGLQAVDEAIGRATEMGKPILYVLGTGTAADIATIAGYTILSRVAKRTAEYQTPILVPVNDPVMLAMGQEVVKEAYLQAGRPDVYQPENVMYVSAMQFPYVAAVNGIMLREKAATNFYMGVFHAESLLLAEAGSVTGAIQISGTDRIPQIPFFVAATDYTLIGEELYAASAYLSQDPVQLGPLKAQDITKVVIVVVIIVGVLSLTLFEWDGIKQLVESAV
ncbi:MAG: hypothetical protein GF355_07915 [Candidatus Eisenbacteria bacterium]|nr:hypothetical protein [Candidatus Eisenbacteria bacterium]